MLVTGSRQNKGIVQASVSSGSLIRGAEDVGCFEPEGKLQHEKRDLARRHGHSSAGWQRVPSRPAQVGADGAGLSLHGISGQTVEWLARAIRTCSCSQGSGTASHGHWRQQLMFQTLLCSIQIQMCCCSQQQCVISLLLQLGWVPVMTVIPQYHVDFT